MKKLVKSIARALGYEITSVATPNPTRTVSRDPIAPVRSVDSSESDRDFDALKVFATSTAQLSASAEATQAIRNLHLSGILRPRPLQGGRREPDRDAHALDVGIWTRSSEAEDAPFVRRSDRKADHFFWANNERIEPKRCNWRVVLVGESVARGYLYDPQFNPASALAGILKAHLTTAEIDVVDLGKTNQTIQELKVIIGQSLALRPDVIVVFAGNNWRPHIAESDIPYIDSVLRRSGVPGMKSFLDQRRRQAVQELSTEVDSLLSPTGVKVVWVIPEFNLDDWVDPASNAPHLVGHGNREWRDLSESADQAFRARDLVLAEKLAKKMVALDGGTSSIPLRILAECRRSNGDQQGARRYLEMCRDAGAWNPSHAFTPRVTSSTQDALREVASASRNIVVDLPEVLSRYFNNALPNRRIFLDYCHLTAEGINVAMAAVATKILGLLTGQDFSFQSLLNGAFSPSAKVEGKTCFLAAVHNAHLYQSYDLVYYWCARAVQFWPECAQIMMRFVDLQARRAPLMACKSAIELFEINELDTLRYLWLDGKQRLDLVLSKAIIESVRTIGFDIGNEISDLRATEHLVRNEPKELTDFYYTSTLPSPTERAWTSQSFPNNRDSQSIYASAFWETSKFIFFGQKGRPIRLKFTYRVPTLCMSGSTVEIDVNGYRIVQVPVDQTWRTIEMSILGSFVVDGINEIVITWPIEEDSSDADLSRAADLLVAKQFPFFYRVFGEVHALLVSDPAGTLAKAGGIRSVEPDAMTVSVEQ